MWFSVVCSLINNDTRHHSSQNVVDSQATAEWDQGIVWHIDVSSIVWTPINNGKLTNQITRLVIIVVKFNFHACQLSNLKIKKTCNPLVII